MTTHTVTCIYYTEKIDKLLKTIFNMVYANKEADIAALVRFFWRVYSGTVVETSLTKLLT